MKINAYASEIQYANKLVAIWDELLDEFKGNFYIHPRIDGHVENAVISPPAQDGHLLVASHKDSLFARHPFIYVEHGAGQAYAANNFYSNTKRPNMLAALMPGPHAAKQMREYNPTAPIFEIGAPHLAQVERKEPKAVVFAFHWRCSIAVESGTAFDEYADAVAEVSKRRISLGHGHPRMIQELGSWYRAHGIPVVTSSIEALSNAAILIADNTSLIYEAALLDIPVILLNHSSWRRNRDWGLRFWDVLPGPQVNRPEDLVGKLEEQINGGYADWKEIRKCVAKYVYGDNPRLAESVRKLEEVVKNYEVSI